MFPFQFSMTMELGNRRTTSFNGRKPSPLVICQIWLCRRGASVAPRSRRLALCPCATPTTLSLDSATRLASKVLWVPSRCRCVCMCVCLCACVECVCVHVHVHVCGACVCILGMHVCLCAFFCVWVFVHVRACVMQCVFVLEY